MSRTRDLGNLGEAEVARLLRGRGCTLLASQWRCRYGEVDLVAAQTIPRSELMRIWEEFKSTVGGALPYVLIGAGLLVVLIIAYVILNIVHNRRRKGVKFRK